MQNNQFNVTLAIKDPGTGVWTQYGTWDKLSGGGVQSSIRKYQPGGGAREIVLGGKRTRDDITLSKMCDVDTDWPLIEKFEQWAGIADIAISIQATRADYTATGIKPRPINGKLTGVTAPEADSESEDPGMLVLSFTVTA